MRRSYLTKIPNKLLFSDVEKSASDFWDKLGKFTKFKTKEEYFTYLKSQIDWFNTLPEADREKYVSNMRIEMSKCLDGLSKNDKKITTS